MSVVLGAESIISQLSWNTRISRTRLSTVDGLSLSAAPVLTAQGLDQLLRTIEQLGLTRHSFEELEHEAIVGEGESFRVERCIYNKNVVAVKHVKLDHSTVNVQTSYHRLQSVLLEIQIMRHNPLKNHPNILQALGYGWKSHGERLLPYVVVEYAAHGSMRAWLREAERGIKVKFKVAGDVASGLKALHLCDIIHGDLKLDNILVVPAPERGVQVVAKLCDFGHSIILRKGTRDFKYFGTILYNAPEVELQETFKIEPENLHKCDIWAYGLSIWELFANGARYFQSSWSTDRRYTSEAFEPPQYRSVQIPLSPDAMSASLSTDSSFIMVSHNDSHNIAFSDRSAESALGSFSQKHLQPLSKIFVNKLNFPGLTIEKGYLRKLLQNTLQFDPALRPSHITLVPTMMDWDRADQGALQEQLALHTGSSALKFEIFSYDQGSEVPWEYKRKILQNLVTLAEHTSGSQDQAAIAASTALQASFCYIAGFGTSPNLPAAHRFLEKAIELQHPMLKLFGKNLKETLEVAIATDVQPGPPTADQESYTATIIRGFRADQLEIKGVELNDNDGALLVGPEKFKDYKGLKVFLSQLKEPQREKTLHTFVITMPFSIRMDLLSLAIAMDDVVTVQNFAKIFIREKLTTPHDETALIQACRRGSVEMVLTLLDAGADPSKLTEDGCSLYHWLFMLDDGADVIVDKLLAMKSTPKNELLDHACSRSYVLHQQCPLKLQGTPLAFAIECNSIAGVKALLKLGASPHRPAYGQSKSEHPSTMEWTPLHLAFKFHQKDIIRLLLKEDSPWLAMDNNQGINIAELARSVCYSTPIERMMMHGAKRRQTALYETLRMIRPEALSTPSEDGGTAFMQAIDFSAYEVVIAMLASDPNLYKQLFVDPRDPTVFTYPAIFAAQIAAMRDSSDAAEIVKLLLHRVPKGTILRDSQGRTPLHFSVAGCSTSTTTWLLNNGYSIHDSDVLGRTAIHNCRSTASLDLLLDLGDFIDQQDLLGFTPLHLAALQGLEDMVEGLIFRNAHVGIVGTIGSALHCAVLAQSRRVMSLLLKADNGRGNKIDINAVDSEDDTALHLAARFLRPDLLQILFTHKINRNAINRAGLTARSQLGFKSYDAETEHYVSSYQENDPIPVLLDPKDGGMEEKSTSEDEDEDEDEDDEDDDDDDEDEVEDDNNNGDTETSKAESGAFIPILSVENLGEELEMNFSDGITPPLTPKANKSDPAKKKKKKSNKGKNILSKIATLEEARAAKDIEEARLLATLPQSFNGIPAADLLASFLEAEKQYMDDVLKWSKWNTDTLNWGTVAGLSMAQNVIDKGALVPDSPQRWDASLRSTNSVNLAIDREQRVAEERQRRPRSSAEDDEADDEVESSRRPTIAAVLRKKINSLSSP